MWMTLKAFLKKPCLMTPPFAMSPLKCANKTVGKMCRINLITCFLSCLYRQKTISSLTIATDHPKPNTNFLREKRCPRKLWYLPPNLELFMQSCYDIHRTEGTTAGLCFWEEGANLRIQFSKGNAMFVSCQPLLQIRTTGKKKEQR